MFPQLDIYRILATLNVDPINTVKTFATKYPEAVYLPIFDGKYLIEQAVAHKATSTLEFLLPMMFEQRGLQQQAKTLLNTAMGAARGLTSGEPESIIFDASENSNAEGALIDQAKSLDDTSPMAEILRAYKAVDEEVSYLDIMQEELFKQIDLCDVESVKRYLKMLSELTGKTETEVLQHYNARQPNGLQHIIFANQRRDIAQREAMSEYLRMHQIFGDVAVLSQTFRDQILSSLAGDTPRWLERKLTLVAQAAQCSHSQVLSFFSSKTLYETLITHQNISSRQYQYRPNLRAVSSFIAFARYLKDHGVMMEDQDFLELFKSIGYSYTLQVTKVFVEHAQNLRHIQDAQGKGFLHYLPKTLEPDDAEMAEIVKTAIIKGADPSQQNNSGYDAIYTGNYRIISHGSRVKKFLAYGYVPSTSTIYGYLNLENNRGWLQGGGGKDTIKMLMVADESLDGVNRSLDELLLTVGNSRYVQTVGNYGLNYLERAVSFGANVNIPLADGKMLKKHVSKELSNTGSWRDMYKPLKRLLKLIKSVKKLHPTPKQIVALEKIMTRWNANEESHEQILTDLATKSGTKAIKNVVWLARLIKAIPETESILMHNKSVMKRVQKSLRAFPFQRHILLQSLSKKFVSENPVYVKELLVKPYATKTRWQRLKWKFSSSYRMNAMRQHLAEFTRDISQYTHKHVHYEAYQNAFKAGVFDDHITGDDLEALKDNFDVMGTFNYLYENYSKLLRLESQLVLSGVPMSEQLNAAYNALIAWGEHALAVTSAESYPVPLHAAEIESTLESVQITHENMQLPPGAEIHFTTLIQDAPTPQQAQSSLSRKRSCNTQIS